MSKAVLISIRQGWCQKIMNGQKTIEVRKTRPKMNPPVKCYIYKCGNGKVIGEFLCDEIININGAGRIPSDIARPTCLEPAELHQYLRAAVGYGWHMCYAPVQLEIVKALPAADVAPVVHGRWHLLDDCANAGLYCSACGRRVHREEFAYKKLRSKYCPHCGARMDGWMEDAEK